MARGSRSASLSRGSAAAGCAPGCDEGTGPDVAPALSVVSTGFRVDGDTVRVGIEDGSLPRKSYTGAVALHRQAGDQRPGVPVECGGLEATSALLAATFPTPIDAGADFLLDRGGIGAREADTDRSPDLFGRYGRLWPTSPSRATPAGRGSC